MRRAVVIGGGVLVAGGLAFVAWGALFGDFRTLKNHAPDETPGPGKTGWKRVDALMPKLRAIAAREGIPLGLLVAWVGKESGGRLDDITKLDERGYFQLMPSESKALGLDHARLSADPDYSLAAGVALIRKYQRNVAGLGVGAALPGSALYWTLVKLCHTVGSGQTKKWIKAAQDAGQAGSWDALAQFVLGKRWAGPQPAKWVPFMNKWLATAGQWGMTGGGAPAVAGFGIPLVPIIGAPGGMVGLDLIVARRSP